MYLSSRKSKIISELLQNDNCITGQYLANVLSVTSRTIRGDICELNAELNKCGIPIRSITGRGYYIPKDRKNQLKKLVKIQEEYIKPVLPDSRVEHILKQLILYPTGISIDSISQQLYVSSSTISRDFIKVNKRLQKNNLRLNKCKENIISISGDELLIREMYCDFFAKAVKLHSLDKSFINDEFNEIFIQTKEMICNIAEQEHIDLTGDEFDAVIILLAVITFRVVNGFSLDNFCKEPSYNNTAISKIINILMSKVNLNIYEQNYINYCIQGFTNKYKQVQNSTKIKKALDKGIAEISRIFKYSYTDELRDKLISLLSNRYYIKSSEHTLSDIKREYPLAFEMAVSLVNSINHECILNMCDEILIQIVLLFAYEMEKEMLEKEMKRRDIVIVCQSGEITSNLIEIKLKRYFAEFNILGIFPLYKIEQALKLNPEIIISTVMVEIENVPVIVINPLFKDYDILKISTLIRQIEHSESNNYEFINLFKEVLFIKDIEAVDKHDVIKKLFDTLQANGYAQENFFQAVIERENISSTAIGNMVAVPHAINNSMGENVVAIGILKSAIDWNGDKVRLVFLINIKNTTDGKVKQIFKSFFNVISLSEKVDRLIKSKNYYEFIKTINK